MTPIEKRAKTKKIDNCFSVPAEVSFYKYLLLLQPIRTMMVKSEFKG